MLVAATLSGGIIEEVAMAPVARTIVRRSVRRDVIAPPGVLRCELIRLRLPPQVNSWL